VLKAVPRDGKHVVVHNLYSTFMAPNACRPQYESTVICATLIGKSGLPLPTYQNAYFEGPVLLQFLGTIGGIQNRHIFSTIEDSARLQPGQIDSAASSAKL
jgi:hypothetical protein